MWATTRRFEFVTVSEAIETMRTSLISIVTHLLRRDMKLTARLVPKVQSSAILRSAAGNSHGQRLPRQRSSGGRAICGQRRRFQGLKRGFMVTVLASVVMSIQERHILAGRLLLLGIEMAQQSGYVLVVTRSSVPEREFPQMGLWGGKVALSSVLLYKVIIISRHPIN